VRPETNDDYEVLDLIGRGGYGEVFLARDRAGRFWAVKVVYRVSFDHERPFEREFEGISKFEPISRLSQSQLQIRHVGRRDAAGYFYYIMELADDMARGRDIRPDEYSPRTLRSDLQTHGRLAPLTCCRIAHALAEALENLHQHRLVHRDIKPGNIIFVNGQPKLADPGLVTDADKSMTCAGTEGYIPPEGPGSARADIYSLGIVLYEAMTGNKRWDFPKLPENFEDWPDHKAALELNRIINKACHAKLRKRYQSARELKKDLEGQIAKAGENGRKRTPNPARRMAMVKTIVCLALWAMVFVVLQGRFGLIRGFAPLQTESVVVPVLPEASLEHPWTNSLGMPFVPVPGRDVLFCIWKTRVQDFEQFAKETPYELGDNWLHPGFPQGPDHPACGVSWNDAHSFCDWLTKKEQQAGTLAENQYYRLPSDADWSVAVGRGRFPWGDIDPPPPSGSGNYKGSETSEKDGPGGQYISGYSDDYPWTSPVGSFRASRDGLFDLGGNLWELCEDWYRKELNNEKWRSELPELNDDGGGEKFKVLRGGAWNSLTTTGDTLSMRRQKQLPDTRIDTTGFRCVLAIEPH
jgi:serine/threonine protein kinase